MSKGLLSHFMEVILFYCLSFIALGLKSGFFSVCQFANGPISTNWP